MVRSHSFYKNAWSLLPCNLFFTKIPAAHRRLFLLQQARWSLVNTQKQWEEQKRRLQARARRAAWERKDSGRSIGTEECRCTCCNRVLCLYYSYDSFIFPLLRLAIAVVGQIEEDDPAIKQTSPTDYSQSRFYCRVLNLQSRRQSFKKEALQRWPQFVLPQNRLCHTSRWCQ